MAFGLPVVSIGKGLSSEWIVDGETGLIIDEADLSSGSEVLDGLWSDRNLRRRMGDREVSN